MPEVETPINSQRAHFVIYLVGVSIYSLLCAGVAVISLIVDFIQLSHCRPDIKNKSQ